jgi:hypothetical protein
VVSVVLAVLPATTGLFQRRLSRRLFNSVAPEFSPIYELVLGVDLDSTGISVVIKRIGCSCRMDMGQYNSASTL